MKILNHFIIKIAVIIILEKFLEKAIFIILIICNICINNNLVKIFILLNIFSFNNNNTLINENKINYKYLFFII